MRAEHSLVRVAVQNARRKNAAEALGVFSSACFAQLTASLVGGSRPMFERANIPHSTRAMAFGICSLAMRVWSVVGFPSSGSGSRSGVQSI